MTHPCNCVRVSRSLTAAGVSTPRATVSFLDFFFFFFNHLVSFHVPGAMTGAAELCNGERAVVFLFVSGVLYSSPLSLSYEAAALCLLAVAGLVIEISAESSTALDRFKTRPGASSGIQLGAVTLPTVMLSRLIQLSRALLRQDVGPEGWFVTKNLLWLLCHGLVTVFLIQYILRTFPSCASIGEALLVSSGLVLYFGDVLRHTLSKINFFFISSKLNFKEYGSQSEIATVIQGLLLGLLLLPVFYQSLLQIWVYFANSSKPEEQAAEGWKYRRIGSSVVFYASLLVISTILAPAWMYHVQDFHVHPLLWVFIFVFTDPLKRLALCIYWICVICASVLRFYNISKHSKIERILLRKYYHLVAVLMFLPALLFQPSFLDLAFGAALAVFLILEMIRVWKIWPLGHIVHQFMNAFTDHRDSEILIISHFSLLLGCALPKWMSSGFNDRPLAPFAGILSLGIGDTMASMVGHKYGVLRWSKTGKKTIEGTAAGIMSVLAACSLLLPLLASTGFILSQHWLSLLLAVTVTGLLEAYTAQLDNAFIPLVFYSLLCL
ncbi:dolichol kinase EVAN isoform X3 [Elaeis guineensis]|uniref:dolichol kinase EVAN isoform X3 n=1 Tax=Elaeis guineensis var. tenera TaxID=51953 RepID=UPI003C6D6FAB